MTPTSSTPEPATGQVWADNDPRARGRHVVIIAIMPEEPGKKRRALVAACSPDGTAIMVNGKHRYSYNRLERFKPTSTGYRYITTVELF